MERRDFLVSSIFGTLGGISIFSNSFAIETTNTSNAITNKIPVKPLKPFYIPPDNSPSYRGAAKIRFDKVNNQLSSFEIVVPPKKLGAPPHVHKDLDEVMRVVKGTITVMVGDEIFEVKEGGWHLRPHGIVHTFWNSTNETAVLIDIYPNQNFEVFLENYIKLIDDMVKEGIQPDSEESIRRQDLLHKEWGIVMYYDQRKPLMEKYGLV